MGQNLRGKLIILGLMVLVGGLSGIFCSQIFLPWLAGFPKLASISWIRQARDGATIINRTEKIVITENQALEEVISQISNTVVGIISQRIEKFSGKKKVILEKPETLAQGSGFIVTSDGLIVTVQTLIPESSQQILVVLGERQLKAEVKKQESASGLVLLKISETNLPMVSFADQELKLGQSLFLMGVTIQEKIAKFIESGIVNQLEPDLTINFIREDINGSPIFNIKGEVIGINGEDKIILSSAIKELLK